MRQLLLSFCFILAALTVLPAQSGCPGCLLNLPAGLPDDTLYLPPLPDGVKGTPYNQDISFRVPKTTTPVHAVDTTTPPGLPISKIEIVGIEDMPPGLFWEASQLVFETATQTDGCIKICGTPSKSDSFVMTVKLKATVFIFSQESSFQIRLYVAPKTSSTDGFAMSNITGCGSTTVTFTNNIPSGGNTGFTYEWDLGDGTTFTGENPPPHTYTKAGKYEVKYRAVIDTVGYRLASATVLSVGCSDLFSSGPDLFLLVKGPTGDQLFYSTPEITNATLPHTWPIGLKLDPQSNYNLEVWDEDSGLEGSDDACGAVPFNILSGDTLTSGAFKVVLNLEHPIDTVFSTDTVFVYPQPMTPSINANTLSACAGSDTIVLESSFGGGNQWWVDGQPIAGATDFLYMPDSSGYYQVEVHNTYGCSAISDSAYVKFHPLPAEPVYVNDRNNLELQDTTNLPANYALQWFLFAGPIAGATGFEYCAQMNGTYTLQVTDLTTGCTASYATTVAIDPNYDCTVGTGDIATGQLKIFPNPASDRITLQLAEPLAENGVLRVWDVAGRLVDQRQAVSGNTQIDLDGSSWQQGMYFLELSAGTWRYIGRLVMNR